MAITDQIDDQNKLNENLEEESLLLNENYDISVSILENLKESVSTRSKMTEFDKNLLGLNRAITKTILDRDKSYKDIDSIEKEIVKNNDLISKSSTLQDSIEKSIDVTRKEGIPLYEKKLNDTKDLISKIEKEEELINKGKSSDIGKIKSLKDKLSLSRENETLTFNNLTTLEKQAILNKQNQEQAEENVSFLKEKKNEYIAQQEKEVTKQNEINSLMGISGGLVDGIGGALKKLGFGKLVGILGLDKVKEKMGDVAKSIQESDGKTNTFANKFKVLKAGIKEAGTQLITSLKDPSVVLGFLFTELALAFLKSDKIIADMAKGLNKSYSEALSMKQELTKAAIDSGNIFVTSEKLSETLMSINKTLGTNVMLNKEDLVTFTKLREMAGFTNEELMGIQALAYATGTSLEDNTKEFMAQAKITAIQNGVMLNEKELAKGIKDISAATTLSLSKNPQALGAAVAAAKSLGMELSKVEAISESLLQFETSIGNELKAELLTGRQLNLEQARYFALTNDVEGVAREIASQLGSASEFSKMNRIQQEALAKAVGMNREELAKTLYIQEQLRGATGDVAKEQRALLNSRIEDVGLAQVQKEMAEDGFKGLQKQVGIQDKFNASVEKLKEAFVGIAEIIMPFVDIFASVVGFIAETKLALVAIQTLLVGVAAKSIAIAIATIFTGSAVVPIWGLIAAGAGVVAMMGLIEKNKNKVADLASPSKGKTQISTKEGGLFELSPNDDVIAAPNLISPSSTTTNNQTTTNTSTTTLDLNPLINEVREMKSLLSAILNKEGDVYIDGNKAGKSLVMAASQMG